MHTLIVDSFLPKVKHFINRMLKIFKCLLNLAIPIPIDSNVNSRQLM